MTQRLRVAFFAVAVLAAASSLFAQCRSDERYPNYDPTTYKTDLNYNLSDYGTFFEEAAPWSSCTQAAADGLYKKIWSTYNLTTWPKEDTVVCSPGVACVNAYQGWLAGGDVALIQATALRLANVGKLSKPLDDIVQRVNGDYRLNVDRNCGFSGTLSNGSPRWTAQNSCMDDYSIGSMGWAWVAAYRAKRGLADASTPAQSSRGAVANALSTDMSVCAWDGRTNVNPAPATGPCTLGVPNISGYIPISLHGGDSQPYGLGLFTSIASAAVALKLADPNSPLALSSDQQAMAQALYNHARAFTYDDELNFHFGSDPAACERFTFSNGALVATANFDCGDENTNYKPTMFPVANFFSLYAPPVQPTPSFDQFDSTLFCNTPADGANCFFYNPGRRSVYGQMAQTWTQSPPNFTNTGLGDYTVSFRTSSGNYLRALSGGGSDVDAVSTAIGPWEQFSLLNRTAGETQLNDGDQITLQAMGMVPYRAEGDWLTATNGGGVGSVMNADQLYPHENETFTIHKLNGTGAINNGDPVALTSVNGYYVSAAGGGGSSVTVDRTAAYAWETFTITINHN